MLHNIIYQTVILSMDMATNKKEQTGFHVRKYINVSHYFPYQRACEMELCKGKTTICDYLTKTAFVQCKTGSELKAFIKKQDCDKGDQYSKCLLVSGFMFSGVEFFTVIYNARSILFRFCGLLYL